MYCRTLRAASAVCGQLLITTCYRNVAGSLRVKKPVSEKQLTGLRPDSDRRQWLCAPLKNEHLTATISGEDLADLRCRESVRDSFLVVGIPDDGDHGFRVIVIALPG